MKPTILLIALIACFWALAPAHLAAPKDDGGDEKIPFTDEQILAKVYDKSYKTPAGFYQDPALKDSNFSLYYYQPNWFASDKDKARKIVEEFLAKPSGIKDKKIDEAKESKKYFDFRAGKIWFRVHNPDWFAPQGPQIDSGLGHQAGAKKPVAIGTLKIKPVTEDAVKDLAEYLWLIRYYNLDGAKVLSSQVKAGDGAIVANLYTTQVVYGDFGLKDEISVVKETFQVDSMTGAVTYSKQVLKKLTGKQK